MRLRQVTKGQAMTYGNDLSANEGERRLREHREPTEETTLRAGNIVVLDERTGVFPVTETDTVVVWSATEIKDDTEDDQTSNRNDLD